MKEGKWDRKTFQGVEINNKVLGIIGCGNIGSIVADRALGLKMRVIAFDPFLSVERAAEIGVEKVEGLLTSVLAGKVPVEMCLGQFRAPEGGDHALARRRDLAEIQHGCAFPSAPGAGVRASRAIMAPSPPMFVTRCAREGSQ